LRAINVAGNSDPLDHSVEWAGRRRPSIDVASMGSARRRYDVVSMWSDDVFSERVDDPAAKYDDVFRVFMSVQFEARPGGKWA
jgi:hypothetical protein